MLECTKLIQLRSEYGYLKTPKEREIQLRIISQHRKNCMVCNGSYQLAGAKQVKDKAFAGSWGLK